MNLKKLWKFFKSNKEKISTITMSMYENLYKKQIKSDWPEFDSENSFTDEGEIATGGMSSIHKVFNKNLLRHEAKKIIDPDLAENEGAVRQFLEEAQITGQLNHPNVPPVYNIGMDSNGNYYFSMKFVQGHTFMELLRAPAYLMKNESEIFRILNIFIKICQAVSFAHSHGVIHCDLKPENIMVGSYGQVYVMDWGIAQIKGQQTSIKVSNNMQSKNNGIIGTLYYMPPELAKGHINDVDERTDIFCLGGILYCILTGCPPYYDKSMEKMFKMAIQNRVIPPQEILKDDVRLPIRLCQIAGKALNKDPEDRYQSVDELRKDVEKFIRGVDFFPTERFENGAVIIKEGQLGDSAYIIETGRCLAYKIIEGKKVPLREMGAGTMFGETAIFSSQVRTASVMALESTKLIVISRESLDQALNRTPWLDHFVKDLANRFREVDKTATHLRQKILKYQKKGYKIS
ncbi:eukaryotic-like serine/threonine-protein kinase [Candidatus Magnetomoraceae bacterium gMMP-15]